METWLISAILLLLLCLTLLTGLPVSFSIGGVAVIAGYFLWGGFEGLVNIAYTAFGELTNFIIVAVPLYIFMANILETTGLADSLYEVVYRWLGNIRGGLAIGTVLICALFAAMAGISSVATVTMGLIALPSMLSRKYDKYISLGSIAAGGALGILIPPSVLMVIYGGLAEVSVGGLFMGGVFPGLVLTALYCAYIYIRAYLRPELAPPTGQSYPFREKLASLRGTLLPIFLVLSVLGTIYTGVATPTEAAAIGAFGAVICSLIDRTLNWTTLKKALLRTASLNAMVLWIMIGGVAFSQVIAVARISDLITAFFIGLEINRWVIIAGMQVVFFILGCFLDPVGIMMICMPIFLPLVSALGFDLIWFGILYIVNMEMAYLTPPFGFNLFIMKGVVPPEITMADIYQAIIPFVFLQAIGLAMVIIFPQLALWLPSTMIAR